MSDRPEAAIALAKAWDTAEAHAIGEPSPWAKDAPDYWAFIADRLEVANEAIELLEANGWRIVRR